MMIERLEKKFGKNNPIFLEEIFAALPDYSLPSVYRFIAESVKEGTLIKFDKGIYYLPKMTEFGMAAPSLERVVERKYVRDEKRVFGIYGKLSLEERFGKSDQIPNAIEVITNNASRAVREVEMKGRKVVIRKSRVEITNDNEAAYAILEFFSGFNMNDYDERVDRLVKDYVKEKRISRISLMKTARAFPAKAIKNMALSGVLDEVEN